MNMDRDMEMESLHTLPDLPRRSATGHKGTYGTVLGIGGSRGMAGAVALAGRSALLGGAGLVRLAVPDPILETVAGFYPEPTTVPCPADRRGRFSSTACPILIRQVETATSVFLGPGLGRSVGLNRLVYQLMTQADRPIVMDADALNALADLGEIRNVFQATAFRAAILTPHPGEFARLRGVPTPSEENRSERLEAAVDFAKEHRVVLVLKGHQTITTDGDRVAVNTTGNPGMATGGSGDVLTGLLASLLGQGLEPFDAARLGVFLHGMAGDLASQRLGEESVLATSILEVIPEAFRIFRGR